MAAPVFRSVRKLVVGSGLPWYLSSSGLGSNVSTWDGPPFMNRWTTCFAQAGKCGFFGASGFGASPWSRSARARDPNPRPERTSRSRRVIMALSGYRDSPPPSLILDHVSRPLDAEPLDDPAGPV